MGYREPAGQSENDDGESLVIEFPDDVPAPVLPYGDEPHATVAREAPSDEHVDDPDHDIARWVGR